MNKNKKTFLACLSAAFLLMPLLVSCGQPSSNNNGGDDQQSTDDDKDKTPSGGIEDEDGEDDVPVTPVKKDHLFDVDLGTAPTFDKPAVYIHYYREDNTYSNWNLWLWEDGANGKQFSFNGQDAWGVIAAYPLDSWEGIPAKQLGIIVRRGNWEEKDGDKDRFINFANYQADDNGVIHLYFIGGDETIYTEETELKGQMKEASFVSLSRLFLKSNFNIKRYQIFEDGTKIIGKRLDGTKNSVGFNMPGETKADLTKKYTYKVTLDSGDVVEGVISKRPLFSKTEFGTLFNYDGNDLGAVYTAQKTTFKVWSPLSSNIKLRIYNNGTPESLGGSNEIYKEVDMVKGDKGVFAAEVAEDLGGKYYTYVVTNDEYTNKEIVDPYAKSCGINGLRGMIVDFTKANPTGWDSVNFMSYDRKELTVYETHVADVTSSPTWTGTEVNRKLFKGMYESGTTYTKGDVTVKTGFDHIKELGVNAVQLVPIFDQTNNELEMTFNWGYNPLNYNCLEGGYSSNPKDGYARITEFKELVKAYHEAGIAIIMDVVYNHVNNAQASNFDVLLPGYFFRYTSDGKFSNGSGCGNETASENYMMRKFMIDSAKFWASEYKLDGFRFDLMGLHDLTTMKQLSEACKQVNPKITIYGEPWTGGESPLSSSVAATQANGNKYDGYGAFNDQMRDALIAGGMHDKTELGWIDNVDTKLVAAELNKIKGGIAGITSAVSAIKDPDKTLNYATCHDNYTLYDRFIATGKFTSEDEAVLKKMNVLANSVVFTSQGTSFMLAGEEFLRTKGGDHNSYMSSYEVNELNYELKIKHLDMFESYKKLINLKQTLGALHLGKDKVDSITVNLNDLGSTFSYKLVDTATNREYAIYHTNGLGDNQQYDLSSYTLYWSTTDGTNKELSAQTSLSKYETLIAYKSI